MTPPIEPTDEEVLWQKLGIRVRPVPAERVRNVNTQWRGGLLILQVAPRSPAAESGFQPGDILAGLGGWETVNANNVRFVMQWKELAQNQPIVFNMIRDGAAMADQRIQMPSYP
jgi:S1-C subfamily serine protease